MAERTVAASNIDVEKGLRQVDEPPFLPDKEQTWDSQNETLVSHTVENAVIVQDSDSDEESIVTPKNPDCTGSLWRILLPKSSYKQPFRIILRKLEKCEKGYPYLASFLDSDENFMIYRRFGFLHTRLLLQKQDEIRIMEEELDRMDKRDKIQNVNLLQCRVDDDLRVDKVGETRRSLLARIEEAILKYDQLLLNSQQLVAANRPPQRDYNSVANFVHHKKPLVKGDDDFIYCKEDLITLRPGRESAWFDAIVEKMLKLFPRAAVKYIFCSKETVDKTTDKDLFLPTKSRVNRLVSVLIMIMILTLLIIPVYVLYHISSTFSNVTSATNAICMGVLLVSTLLFSAALALFTKAKRHELLGAAAAYCALLVVFIANLGFNGNVH